MEKILPLLATLGTATFYLLYMQRRPGRKKGLELAFKGLATLCAAGLALYGAARFAAPGSGMLAAGLMVCTVADVVLELHFLGGMAAFALGHLCYSIAFVQAAPPTAAGALVSIALAALSVAAYRQLRARLKTGCPPSFLAYALVLCALVGLAASQKPLLLAGAALFALSDALLARRILLNVSSVGYNYLCLGVYYLAQLFMGISTLV